MNNKKRIIIAAIAVMLIALLLVLKCGRGTVKPDKQGDSPAAEENIKTDAAEKSGTEKPADKVPSNKSGAAVNVKVTEKGKIFEVVKDGKTVINKQAGDKEGFKLVPPGTDKTNPEVFADLTGDKKPDFVLQSYSEKDSCSNIYSVFSAEDDFKMMAEIKGLSEGISFKDLNADGVPELIGNDCTFLNWWASFGGDTAPKVILEYKDGAYLIAAGLMKQSPPLDEEMREYAEKNKNEFISYVWEYMLNLIYGGNGDKAWEFYDMVQWNEDWESAMTEAGRSTDGTDKGDFLEAFKEHLSTSPYWEEIKKMNNWDLEGQML
ncbi:MAG: hypothetical protein JXR81_07010 [Candidatus Goldbacteria bacterium]|nr:hypothetical protein [Candidatus Goldiibacteriota bacterium]